MQCLQSVTVTKQLKHLKTCDLYFVRMNMKHPNIYIIHTLYIIHVYKYIHLSKI